MFQAILMMAAVSTCHPRVAVQKQVVVQQQLVPAQVLYLVGSELRLQSSVQSALRQDPQWQQFQQWKQQQQQQTGNVQRLEHDGGQPTTMAGSICGKCHSGNKIKGDFDISKPLSAAEVTKAIRMLSSGKMPPQNKLSPQYKQQILTDLLNFEEKHDDEETTSPELPEPSDDVQSGSN